MSWQRIKAVILETWSTPKFPPPPPGYKGTSSMPERKPSRPEIPEIITIAAGDTIMLTCRQIHDRQQAANFRQSILEQLPAGCKVVVIYGGAKVEAILRAKPERGPIPHIPQPSPGRL